MPNVLSEYRALQKAFDAARKETGCAHYDQLAEIIIALHEIGVTDWRDLKRRAVLAVEGLNSSRGESAQTPDRRTCSSRAS